jgi:hypothetical protein
MNSIGLDENVKTSLHTDTVRVRVFEAIPSNAVIENVCDGVTVVGTPTSVAVATLPDTSIETPAGRLLLVNEMNWAPMDDVAPNEMLEG